MRLRTPILLLWLVISTATPSTAAIIGKNSSSHNIASGRWAAVLVGLNQTPINSPYQLSWGANGLSSYDYFSLQNTGTFDIKSAVLTISQVKTSGSTRPNNITFEICINGSWNTTTNTCPTSVFVVGSATNQVVNLTNLNLSPTSLLNMRAVTDTNSRQTYTTTLSVSISRAGIRSGAISNS